MARATVRFGRVARADGTVLWVQRGEVDGGDGHHVVDRVLVRQRDGKLLLSGSDGPVIEVDQTMATITLDGEDSVVHRQLVAAFALPLILHAAGALMLHGAACALGDQAILVCGESGAGKSSTLVRLVDAGWSAVSEDVCAIDLDAPGGPVVWPGPPWVRVARDERGPQAAALLFDQIEKAAWDLSAHQTTEPTPLKGVAFLEPPGGAAPAVHPVSRPDAVRALAHHAVWLQEQDDRARQLFAPLAALASRVPAFRVQLPRHDDWSQDLPDLLASSVLVS